MRQVNLVIEREVLGSEVLEKHSRKVRITENNKGVFEAT